MNQGNTFGRKKRLQYNNVFKTNLAASGICFSTCDLVKLNRIDGVTSI